MISKRTLPSIPGGLLNKAFIYSPAAQTDIRRRFEQERERRVAANPGPATAAKGGAVQ